MSPAPKGNQFWKLRSTHGRDKLFESSEKLWEAACEYFTWCDENPFKKQEAIKSGDLAGTTMNVEVMRPYTMEGLCHYLDCNKGYFNDFELGLDKEKDKDFSVIVTRIRETIYRQKFEGAASNFLNANIIARDLGLVEKKELKADVNNKSEIDLSKATTEELKKIAAIADKYKKKDNE